MYYTFLCVDYWLEQIRWWSFKLPIPNSLSLLHDICSIAPRKQAAGDTLRGSSVQLCDSYILILSDSKGDYLLGDSDLVTIVECLTDKAVTSKVCSSMRNEVL